jgi:glucose/arabinose dehydrogenase
MHLSPMSYPGGSILRAVVVAFSGLLLLFLGACNGGDEVGGGGGAVTPASPFPAISLVRVATGFTQPVLVTHAADGSGRLFVVERAGVVRILRNGAVEPTPFLDISALVRTGGSEQGLLGLAFPPDYRTRQHFYVYYTGKSGVGDTVVARYRLSADPDVADPANALTLLRQAQPFANHNGGHLAFGPDGYLYVGLGDGGAAGDPLGNAQNSATLLGKLLRIDVESGADPYAIPANNPFGNEIWALGLRNPWRFSFDRVTGDLYIGDVGQSAYEEVNFQPAASRGGHNYGWNVMEGMHCYKGTGCKQTGLTAPVAEYSHDSGNCSITGGFVYRGPQYPSLQGVYLYGDFCSGQLWGLRRSAAGWENALLLDSGLNLSSFGEDESGNLYVADYGRGDLYRIALQ